MSTSQKRATFGFYYMFKGHIQAKQETVIQISSKDREEISPSLLLPLFFCSDSIVDFAR